MSSHSTLPRPSRTIPSLSRSIPPTPSATTLSHTASSAPSTTSPHPPRIHALLVNLSIIKHALSASLLLQSLITRDGRFCLSCYRRRRFPGSCGPTCALLRRPGRHNFYRPAEAPVRAAALRRAQAAYFCIIRDIQASRGRPVPKHVLENWEERVRVLSMSFESFAEKLDRVGWEEMEKRGKWGHFKSWEFEGAWGKGAMEEEAVPPEVLVKGREGRPEGGEA